MLFIKQVSIYRNQTKIVEQSVRHNLRAELLSSNLLKDTAEGCIA